VGTGSVSVHLSKNSEGYEIFFLVKNGSWNDKEAVSQFQSLATRLSFSIFKKQPVAVSLCDDDFNPQKTLHSVRAPDGRAPNAS
jgi:hypothetical protein